MNTKDYIVIIISGSALTLSLISLVITLVQKRNEVKRTIRKTLSDTLEGISKINIESTKLHSTKDSVYDFEAIISLRRNYNTQRRVLIAHADFLIRKYDKIATEIDCGILAHAYSFVGDQQKSEYFWEKTISKSVSGPIKHMNLRGFGNFLFSIDKVKSGREKFNEALSIDLIDNDGNNFLKADTYLTLAGLEREKGNNYESELNISKAVRTTSRIKSDHRRGEMSDRIKGFYPIPQKENVTVSEKPVYITLLETFAKILS